MIFNGIPDHEAGAGADPASAFASFPGLHEIMARPSVAVALSGGPDSMALAWLVARAAAESGVMVHMLTVDHGLRPGSAAEAGHVAAAVGNWPGGRHEILRLAMADDARTSVMEKARGKRYEAMAVYCRDHGISSLFLAHHLDDQAETFLFRLAKGSGLDGLAAMRPAQAYGADLTLLRPLLTVPKENLVALCVAEGLDFVRDPTNESMDFARNRLRAARDILAAEGLTARRLGVTASRLSRAREALEFYARDVYDRALVAADADKRCLDFALVAAQPEDIRLRVLLLAMGDLRSGAPYPPRMDRVEALAAAMFDAMSETTPDEAGGFPRRALGGVLISCRRGKKMHGNDVIVVEREKPCAASAPSVPRD